MTPTQREATVRVIERKIQNKLMDKNLRQGEHRLGDHDKIVVNGDTRSVFLFGTEIATVNADKLILRTGGYTTKTTNSRLNCLLDAFAPAWRLTQKNFKLTMSNLRTGEIKEFTEGCQFPI